MNVTFWGRKSPFFTTGLIAFALLCLTTACSTNSKRNPSSLESPEGQAQHKSARLLEMQTDEFTHGLPAALTSVDLQPGQKYPYRNKENAFLDNVKNRWEKRLSLKAQQAAPPLDSSPRRRVSHLSPNIQAQNDKRFRITNKSVYTVAVSEREARAQIAATPKRKMNAKVIPGNDDQYEPNNLREQATDLRNFENQWLFHLLGEGSLRNTDWYQVQVSPFYRELILDLRFQHYYGDLTLKLYNDQGELIAMADGSSDDEYLRILLAKPGQYFVEISGETTGNSYDFRWETEFTGNTEDLYEDNDSLAKATPLSSFEGKWLSDIRGEGMAGDDDFYSVKIGSKLRLVVDLRFENKKGDLDLKVYNSEGKQIASSTRLLDDERIDFDVPSKGNYFIRVYPYERQQKSNLYDLKWQSYVATPAAVEDRFEPNDIASEAVPKIELGNPTAVIDAAQFDLDWYRFQMVEKQESLQLQISNLGKADALNFFVVSEQKEMLAAGTAQPGERGVLDLKLPQGVYYLKITGDNLGSPYQVRTGLSGDSL